jgi:hypothetical protein
MERRAGNPAPADESGRPKFWGSVQIQSCRFGHVPRWAGGGPTRWGPPGSQIYELVGQLRRENGARQVPGARIALAENGGGMYAGEEAVAAVTILGA